jgi:hypothetical protein
VTATAHRARRRWHARTGRVRAALATAALLAVVPAAGCGTNAQTLRPYTPSEGVNFDVGDLTKPDSVIHVRNLLIISRSAGSGIVSATMVTSGRDTLVGVSGVPYKADSSAGPPFTAKMSGPVLLTNNSQVVLTNLSPLIKVSGAPGLAAGLLADVTLDFGKAGSVTTRTTVVDGTIPPYASITPSPSPSVTASPSPTPSATP